MFMLIERKSAISCFFNKLLSFFPPFVLTLHLDLSMKPFEADRMCLSRMAIHSISFQHSFHVDELMFGHF